MPKQSEKKKAELEQLQRGLKTNPREKKPFENYLGFVKELNKKGINGERLESRDSHRKLSQVASLPNLSKRNLNTEQKLN